MTRARVTSKGQITVPKEVRDRLGIEPGDALDFQFDGDRLQVKAVRRRRVAEFRGLFPVAQSLDFQEERTRARAARARRLTEAEDTPHA